MSRTSTRTSRRPARSVPPPRRPGAKDAPSRVRAVRAWALFGGGALVVLLLLWGLTRLLAGGGDGTSAADPGTTGPTGAGATAYAPLPPEGSVASRFPSAVDGTRLELKVMALGDDPGVCRAEALMIDGEERTVYHHRCRHEEDIDRAFFLVRLTNRTDARVPVELERFTVLGADGQEHEAILVPPVGVSGARFFPPTATLGVGASLKRWVTIDGSDGERPKRLIYQDGPETLSVRIDGRWV